MEENAIAEKATKEEEKEEKKEETKEDINNEIKKDVNEDIKEEKSEEHTAKETEKKKISEYVKYAVFPIIFIYLEIVYKLATRSAFSVEIVYPVISALTLGIFVKLITSLAGQSINKILGYTILIFVCVLFCVQIVYKNTFTTPFAFSIAFGEAGGVHALTEFADQTQTAIIKNVVWIIISLLPIVALIPLGRKFGLFKMAEKKENWILLIIFLGVHIIGLISLLFSGDDGYTPKVLYYDHFVNEIGFDKLGVITSTKLDLKESILGVSDYLEKIEEEQKIPVLAEEHETTTPEEDTTSEQVTEETTEEETTEEETTVVVEEPVRYEPNIINIDLDRFSSEMNNSDITWLNDYIKACEPTMKNEYTGMFEGYNVILITAESFSPWAVSEKYTPTLYKLVNSGFVFNNFYMHGYTATTVGEYIMCTGLLANGRGAASPFDRTVDDGNKYMGMCMGRIMENLSCPTFAYHDHSYSYYNRDKTHPNMGYTYKGLGNGLDVKKTWPESDLEMMEKTVDEYINEDRFHAYYMSVSGHMNYDFTANMMSYKHKDEVADMDEAEGIKAYVACNIEFDQALEYLINRLEEKGIADKTVIAIAADHYPYGIEQELRDKIGEEEAKWYGLQKSNLIIWSASMDEPVQVDKVCSSVDVIPTLLNLLGIEYDSRLYSGKDILSDSPGLVVFSNMGFMTDYCIYNSRTGEVKETAGIEVPKEYITTINKLVKNMWNAAGKIIQVDYYAKMKDYIIE